MQKLQQTATLWHAKPVSFSICQTIILEKLKDDSYPDTGSVFFDCFDEVTDSNGRELLVFKDDGIPYEVKYAEVIRLEKLIEEKDTELLTQLVKRREMFWT